jgi:hypothetical protein
MSQSTREAMTCTSCGASAPFDSRVLITFPKRGLTDVLCWKCWAVICSAATAALLVADDPKEST